MVRMIPQANLHRTGLGDPNASAWSWQMSLVQPSRVGDRSRPGHGRAGDRLRPRRRGCSRRARRYPSRSRSLSPPWAARPAPRPPPSRSSSRSAPRRRARAALRARRWCPGRRSCWGPRCSPTSRSSRPSPSSTRSRRSSRSRSSSPSSRHPRVGPPMPNTRGAAQTPAYSSMLGPDRRLPLRWARRSQELSVASSRKRRPPSASCALLVWTSTSTRAQKRRDFRVAPSKQASRCPQLTRRRLVPCEREPGASADARIHQEQ